jgi:hypothetical protein
MEIKSLANIPALLPASHMYWEGFNALSAQRNVSQSGPQPITFAEMDAYMRIVGIDDAGLKEDFVDHILRLDRRYIEAMRKAAQRPNNQDQRGAKPARRSRRR